jgi:hypothetical protein
MVVNLNINPDLVIAWERMYQDYIYECQMLLVEVPDLAKKLATYIIQKEQHWLSAHVNIEILATYDKCFKKI